MRYYLPRNFFSNYDKVCQKLLMLARPDGIKCKFNTAELDIRIAVNPEGNYGTIYWANKSNTGKVRFRTKGLNKVEWYSNQCNKNNTFESLYKVMKFLHNNLKNEK